MRLPLEIQGECRELGAGNEQNLWNREETWVSKVGGMRELIRGEVFNYTLKTPTFRIWGWGTGKLLLVDNTNTHGFEG